jgi:3-oxoacyl-[acyl-carrier protein] reductase
MIPSRTKTAIVTGASRGIGAAIAERLARDGFSVLVNYASDKEAAKALVAHIEEAGGRVRAFKGSVADPAIVKAMFDEAERGFGGVDVLVNNAGIMELAPLAETDDAMFDRTFAINLKGVFNGLREAGRRLRDGGRVVISRRASSGPTLRPTAPMPRANRASRR